LKVPSWSQNATIQIATKVISVTPGLVKIPISPGQVVITLNVPMTFKIVRQFNDAAAIYRGPLLYALKMNEKWTELKHYAFNSSDWQIDPTTKWAYGILIDEQNPDKSILFVQGKVGPIVFSPDYSPVKAILKGRFLPQWTVQNNAAAPPPPSPQVSNQSLEDLTLIPFGASNLRIVEFPTLVQ